ncbi:MAG: hypothetical protein ABIJ27_04865 [Candidatus Omnitrophota bacterium]
MDRIAVGVFPLTPAVFALRKYNDLLKALIIGTALYCISLPRLLSDYSITGASAAYVIFYAAWTVSMIMTLKKKMPAHR